MGIDIKIKDTNCNFHYCVRGILKQDNKFLIMKVNDAEYYHLSGGHVEIGETSEQAVIREMKEELGFDTKIDKLVCINEQFYEKKDSKNHSIIFYYVVIPTNPIVIEDKILIENDKGKAVKNELKWVTVDELKDIDLKPPHIKDLIVQNKLNSLTHIVK
jgi:ADP-ribose pyrophosphatase YjhB (NUDIX family)